MTKNPWMKFYPTDWRADPALRMCSLAARGLWIEMIGLMHEAEPHGHLLVKGKQITAAQLAGLVGSSAQEVETLLLELESADVFSRKKNGVIFSRRMESDEEKARKNRENGKMGGNPSLSKTTEKEQSVNPQDKAQKPDTRSQKPDTREDSLVREAAPDADLFAEPEPDYFEQFMAVFPRRDTSQPRKPAQASFKAALKKTKPLDIIAAASRFAAHCDREGSTGTKFVPMAATWLNQERWTINHDPQPAIHTKPTRNDDIAAAANRVRERLGVPVEGARHRQHFDDQDREL